MRFFNTEGPIQTDIHYFLPPLERMKKDELLSLIAARKYFVLHAPRQTGKTTCLLALADELNQTGLYRALYVNVETAQAAREDVPAAMSAILNQLALQAQQQLKDDRPEQLRKEAIAINGGFAALNWLLAKWSEADPLPLALLLDEVDTLIGDTLISLLRQLRAGYPHRPARFPQSAILCGVRDVRDYRIHSSKSKEIITGGGAFNIKAESLRLGDFTLDEIKRLYRQHTGETGQAFADDIFPLVWELTGGQPWLVNALAYEACFRMPEGKDRSHPITVGIVEQAKENLILRRDTHLDQLADKLQEERVRRVVEPLLTGGRIEEQQVADDIQYVIDLGLIRRSDVGLEVSNAIYREIIPRELTVVAQINFESTYRPESYVTPDGRLEMVKLLEAFQQFFRESSESWLERFDYKEAGPQLLLQAFLQRILNGGGNIHREYGLGRGRTDLLVAWPYANGVQRFVLELKLRRGEKTLPNGLAQTASYMDRCGASEGHLVIFDRRKHKKWEEKIYRRTETHGPHTINVWGM
jgi:hypothetical protein